MRALRRARGAAIALACAAGATWMASPARAQGLIVYGDESAAGAQGPVSLFFNPALFGVRHRSEFALTIADPSGGKNNYRGAFAANGFSFGMAGESGQSPMFSMAFANGPDPMRIGFATSWIPNQGGHDADSRMGLLSRPSPWLSFGAVGNHLEEASLDGVRQRREYTAALGLRPLALSRPKAHTTGTMLTLTGDAILVEGQGLDDARYRLGAELEPVPGLVLSGSYFTKDHGFQLGVILRGVHSAYEGRSAYDRDRDRIETLYSISAHPDEEKTVLAPHSEHRVAIVRAGGDLGDDALTGFSIYGSTRTTAVASLHQQLERALEDPLTQGVLLDVRGVANMAQVEELRPRIERLRQAGKPVVAYIEAGASRADFYLAGPCDKIVSSPEAFYAGLGLRSERRYYRRALADLGIRIDRVSEGKYKSAYRNFSVDSTSAADREVIEHTLDQVQELFVSAITADRHMSRERLMPLIDGRRWMPSDLKAAGLIDAIGYREDAFRELGTLCRMGKKPRAMRLNAPIARREWTLPTHIALVYATGGIESGRSGNDLLLGPIMGSETMTRQVESAFKRKDVQAVVLRVESPGGSSLASDLIHHSLVRMRGDTRKPLIVSMGGVAGSGGYEIAIPGQKIYADRFTRTGSIGVVFVKPSLEGFYEKHHVRQQAFERGEYMRGLSEGQDWDREIQASADSSIHREYVDFVQLVASSRNLTFAQAEQVAQGRVWLGQDAVDRKLVDQIGGLEDAIAEARRLAKVPPGEKIKPVEYRRPTPSLVERLVGSMVTDAWERNLRVPESGASLYWMDPEAAW